MMRQPIYHLLPLFLLLMGVILIPNPAAAQDKGTYITPDDQFSFAEGYFSNREYDKAVTEYERFLHLFPNAEQRDLARYRIGMARFHQGQYEEAIRVLGNLIQENVRTLSEKDLSDPVVQSVFSVSRSYLNLENLLDAVQTLNFLIRNTNHPEVRRESRYQLAWAYIEAGEWEQASTILTRLNSARLNPAQLNPDGRASDWEKPEKIDELLAALKSADAIPQKDPVSAGVLALVPGAGYLYTERYRDALTAFLINGALMAAAFEAWENDNEILAGIIGVVEVGFYTGSIYGSISSAHKYNRRSQENYIEGLKGQMGFRFSAMEDGFLIGLQYRF